MQETRVQSLGWEDPLEKGMEAHSRILARRIPRTEEPGGLRLQRVGHDWAKGLRGRQSAWKRTCSDEAKLLPPRTDKRLLLAGGAGA